PRRARHDRGERGHIVYRRDRGQDCQAAGAVGAAAEEAAGRRAHAGAAGLYRRAAELTPESDRALRWEWQASVELADAGDVETSVFLARRLVGRLPPGALRARARHVVFLNLGAGGMSYEEGVTELEGALADASGDRATEAQLHVDLSELACGMCRLEDAVSHARTATELADSASEDQTAVAALSILGFAESMLDGGVPETARTAFERWDGTIGAPN